MRVLALLALITMTAGSVAEARAIQPSRREIRASVSGGFVSFSGRAARLMENGPTVGGDIGIALAPSITAGMRVDVGFPASKIDAIGPSRIPTGTNHWRWYSTGLFGEYTLRQSSLSPVVGGRVGVDGMRISYVQNVDGSSGVGDYGVGYGMYLGLRYRPSQRLGGVLSVGAERSPGTSTGWLYPARLGLAVFL